MSEDTEDGSVAMLGKLVEFVRLDPAVVTNLSSLEDETRAARLLGDGGSKYPRERDPMAIGGVG